MSLARVLLVILATTLLGGCSGLLLGAKEPAVTSYLLAPDLPAGNPQGQGPILSVSQPRAAAGYATNRMAYLEKDFRLDYYARSAWVDNPAEMLRPPLLAALIATGRFRAVTDEPGGVDPDLRLDLTILHLHQDFRTRPSRGVVRLRAQLVDPDERRVLATRLFEQEEPAPTEDAYGGVVAINRALTGLLRETAAFAGAASAIPQQSDIGAAPPLSTAP